MLLSIGTIIVIDKDFTKDSEKFKSKVVDIGDGFVMIDYPTHIETGRTAFFMDGTQLNVTFIDNLKMSYAFRTEVSGRLNEGIPMIKLSYPGDDQLIKVQRREFVRVESAIDIAVEKDGRFTQYVAADFSAGGVALNLLNRDAFKVDEILSLTIVLPFMNHEIKYVKADARVIRIWEKDGRIIASLQFEAINQVERQYVIRFCFERQLQMRDIK
ncbi:glycosyltransferase [Sporosarcina sp. ANT_H38]|uniref:flagellar brake protein n=1 Tax=Sporosarcina sp. ANT_H38 TaxID=2597358 RepID=UPI0011F28699|nr:flagellar brake domain-containing protein [Sporosarcina sp. ANT_H38]KAA0966150.1 glycosyltransferase [Sporosarcina sp. ANT_H38]